MDLSQSISLTALLPQLKKDRWKLRYAVREIITLVCKLQEKGWNHGHLTTRNIVAHTQPGWYTRHYLTDFCKLTPKNDSLLVASRHNIWSEGRVFLPEADPRGVQYTYAVWLVALELFLGEALALCKMNPKELAATLNHRYSGARKEERDIFQLLLRYFNSEAGGSEVPGLEELHRVLGGSKAEVDEGL